MSKKRTNWLRAAKVSRCFFVRCKRPIEPGDKIVLMGMDYAPMHKRHAKHLNFVARVRLRWAGSPGIAQEAVEQRPGWNICGRYELARNLIFLNPTFWELTPSQAVYLVSHETLHWVLSREFGVVASFQFDGLYHRGLRCLDGRSIHEFELNRLHESYHDTANL